MANIDEMAVGTAAAFLRVSVRTLQRWDNEDRLPAQRTETNRRYYTRAQLDEFVQNHSRIVKHNRTIYLDKEE